MDNQLETLDLGKIRKNLQIEDENLLNKYLRDIWSDLSKRSKENEKGITKVTFNKYYDLPGIISERLFSCFDKDKDGVLSLTEFVYGMRNLYSQEETFDSLAKFIFNLYDFNSIGKIKKDDVRVVLSYVPLQKNDEKTSKEGNIHIVEEKFEDRVESQEQLFNILNLAFKSKDEMNFEEYIDVVKNVNSDIFILILMFLLEKKPFSIQSIQLFAKGEESPKKIKVSRTPKMDQQKIATPSMESRFLSPKLKKKNLVQKKGISEAQNILQLYSGVDNKKVKVEDNKGEKKEKDDKESKRPQRRVRIKLDNLADKTPELSKNTFTYEISTNNSDTNEDFDDLLDNEDSCVQYEGYVYKYSQPQKKMKKTYFKLVGKDLYYYKKKEETTHRGMHNLSGVFIKKGDTFEFEGKKYLSIVILYKVEKSYYFDNEEDYNTWFEKLSLAIQNKSLFDKYEVKQKVGKGKFGLVKYGINKETKKPVAIKIMAKKIWINQIWN